MGLFFPAWLWSLNIVLSSSHDFANDRILIPYGIIFHLSLPLFHYFGFLPDYVAQAGPSSIDQPPKCSICRSTPPLPANVVISDGP